MSKKSIQTNQFIQFKSEAETEEAHRYLDSRKRKAISKDWHLGGMVPRERAAFKRAIKRIVRKPKKYARERAKLTRSDLVMLLRGKRPSKVLDYIFPERNLSGRWAKFDKRFANFDGEPINIDLREFSFLDNPERCLEGFSQIAEQESKAHSVRLNFKDKYCLDIVPYMLLTEFRSEMLPIFRGGDMDVPMQKVLAAIGIEEDLKVGFPRIVNSP